MAMRFLIAVAVLVLAPAAADAATVTVREAPGRDTDEVHYVAAPGERNRLLVSYAGDARSVTVTDPGAVIVALAPCVSVNANTARCVKRPQTSAPFLQSTRAELLDGDDTVRTFRPTSFPIGGVIALGGPGDDVLDGGAGHDRISYAGRAGPVSVRLGDALTDGAPGEGDVVRDFEDATGGAGDDTLIGDRLLNGLSGGAGDDVLHAGPGDSETGLSELLRGGPGRDRLRGGGGPDAILPGRGRDRVGCGRGRDLVSEPQRGELLRRRCELIRFAFGPDRENSLSLSPHPRRVTAVAARFRLGCPSFELLDGELSSCRGPLTLREAAASRRLLGRGRIADSGRRPSFRVRVPLTGLGSRLAARASGVRATASIRGRGLPRRAWTIPLRIRR